MYVKSLGQDVPPPGSKATLGVKPWAGQVLDLKSSYLQAGVSLSAPEAC